MTCTFSDCPRCRYGYNVIEVQRVFADDWKLWRELRLEALAQDPDAFGSTLADWADATEDRWRRRFSSIAYNSIARFHGKPAGQVSCLVSTDVREIVSMWVAAFARGRGVGDALLTAAIAWVEEQQPTQPLILNVRVDNRAALNLYRRQRFVDAGPTPDQPPTEPAERRMVLTR